MPETMSARDEATHERTAAGSYPADRRHAWRLPIAVGGVALAVALLARLIALVPALALAGASVGPALGRPISLLTGAVPFAVGELLVGAYAAWIIALAAVALHDVKRADRRWRNALEGGARRAVRDGGIILIAFHLLFGMNYARPPYAATAGWPAWDAIEPAELALLSETSLHELNEAYLALHGEPDAGAPTAMPADLRTLDAALDDGWARAAAALRLPPAASLRYGPVKWPATSGVLARLGLAGVYFPFTAEANVVHGLPAARAVVTMAHEKAHQRGTASEAEANFFGFFAAALAPDPLARYSAASYAHSSLMGILFLGDSEEWARIRALRLPGVQRDYDDLLAYYNMYDGLGQSLGSAFNDAYLRANRVTGGVEDYRRTWRLLVAQARQQGGRILPE
jgi:hypothetical protein